MNDIKTLNRRHTRVAWGVLLIWIGAVSFVPGERVSLGVGLLGIGVILLGTNLVRYLISRIPAKATDVALGALALAFGLVKLFRSLVPLAMGLIVIGAILLIRGILPPKTG